MKNLMTPDSELKYAQESFQSALAQGLTHASDFSKKLYDTLPSIIRGFAPVKDTLILPDLVGLDKNQAKFVKITHEIPFSELRELRAFVPEGVFSTYLEYLQVLHPVTEYQRSIQGDVIAPFVMILAQIVSDAKGNVSTNNHRAEFKKLEKNREEAYARFSKLYAKDSVETQVKVKNVIERNADWPAVLNLLNQCVSNMQDIDREAIKQQIQQCNDYLDIIYTYLKEGKLEGTSLEAAQSLSDGSWQVAQELQFFSTTYYRVLSLNAAIEKTVMGVTEAMG